MSRAPKPDLNAFPEAKYTAWKHWLSWAAQKLGVLPSALPAATKVWDPGSLADGFAASTSVDVPNARVGDPVSVGFSSRVRAGMFLTGAVETDGVVWVTLGNLQAGTQDLGEGTLRVIVWRVDV